MSLDRLKEVLSLECSQPPADNQRPFGTNLFNSTFLPVKNNRKMH